MLNGFLILLALILFTVIAWKNIHWSLYLVSALLPAYLIRFNPLGLPSTLLEGLIIILFVIWLVKEKISLNPLVWLKNIKAGGLNSANYNAIPQLLRWPVMFLLTAAAISVFVSPDLRAAAGIWKAYFIEPVMFLLVFVYSIKTTAEIKNIIRALGCTALAIGLFALLQKLTGAFIANPFWAEATTRRITAFFEYPNAVDLFLGPIVFLTIGLMIMETKLSWRWFNIAVLAFSLLAIIWAKSTGALIALAVGLFAWLIFYQKTRLYALVFSALICLAFIFTPAIQNKIADEFFLASQSRLPLKPSDLAIRTQMWRETLAMLAERPIFGAGLVGYQTLVAPYHANPHIEIYLYPHNFILNFWSETGLLGLAAIIWLIVVFFRLARSAYRQADVENKILTLAVSGAMISLLVHGLVDVPYFKNDLAVLFWIIVGIIIVLYNQKNLGRVA